MSDQAKRPERLKPFYETPEPGIEIPLIEEVATLKQGDSTAKGTVKITQEWSPMGLYWDFSGTTLDDFEFGEVDILSNSFTATGRLFSKGPHRIAGYINGKVEIGTDHKLDRVTFHLADYPDITGRNVFFDEIQDGTTTTSLRWSEVVLEADGWQITLQPYKDNYSLRRKARRSQQVVLSGIGGIRRANGEQFKKKSVLPLLEALRIFLSFAFAEWSPPLLVVGSNKVAERSFQLWSNYDVAPRSHLSGWLDDRHGDHLTQAFPGFMARWASESWREPLELAVTWLIEASRRSGGTEGAIAFGQIPLEMLAWLVFVEDKTIVDPDEFDKLSAASKLQMLLSQCGVPFEVPTRLTALATVAAGLKKKTGKLPTGPNLVTKVRNSIIHPNERNRRMLSEWEKDYAVKISDIRWETRQLFKSYITLVLLQLIGYSDKYANHITPRKLGELEYVPWAVPIQPATT